MKILFLLAGFGMAAAGAWTLARPLWREGHRLMALFAGLVVAGLFAGLLYFLLG
ncbi:MAG TPA: hypothetical protein GXX28_01115 [Firmicutes bacterium]|nr:hypothetical protein [Bacillota bacterium]